MAQRSRKPRQPETFGNLVLGLGFTMTSLAAKSGVARRTLIYWRDGTYGPQEASVLKVAKVLGVDAVRVRDAILASGRGKG